MRKGLILTADCRPNNRSERDRPERTRKREIEQHLAPYLCTVFVPVVVICIHFEPFRMLLHSISCLFLIAKHQNVCYKVSTLFVLEGPRCGIGKASHGSGSWHTILFRPTAKSHCMSRRVCACLREGGGGGRGRDRRRHLAKPFPPSLCCLFRDVSDRCLDLPRERPEGGGEGTTTESRREGRGRNAEAIAGREEEAVYQQNLHLCCASAHSP